MPGLFIGRIALSAFGTSRHFLAPRVLNAIGAIADIEQAAPIKLGAAWGERYRMSA